MRNFFSKLFYIIFILLAFAFIAGLLAKVVNPNLIWPIAFAGLGFSITVLGVFLFGLYWLVTKNKKVIQPIILLLILFFSAPEFLTILPKKRTPTNNATTLKVMSYNVRNFEAYDRKNKFEKRDRIFNLINNHSPDVICFQEAFESNYDFSKLPDLKKRLNMPHVHFESGTKAKSGKFGVAVFSKYPITTTEKYPFGSGGNVGSKVNISVNDTTTISLFNIHLESANIESKYYNYADEQISKLSRKALWKRSERVVLQLKRAFEARSKQAELIHKEVKATDYPVIVCGDFNDSPMSYSYQTVKGNLYDTFKYGKSGIGVTYPALPFMRIDHILTSKEFTVLSHQIVKEKISDHYPVIVELELKKITD